MLFFVYLFLSSLCCSCFSGRELFITWSFLLQLSSAHSQEKWLNGWSNLVQQLCSALEDRKTPFKMRNEHAASAYLASRHRPSLPKRFGVHSPSAESRPCRIRSNSKFVTLRF
ncbi:hypothetical protein BGZ57DRAFT_913532 [Hyaloscypha finlandica]|nr:hypothetical protein BGZ57DRAFT_913532 [Hyaloscypha finlandica]